MPFTKIGPQQDNGIFVGLLWVPGGNLPGSFMHFTGES